MADKPNRTRHAEPNSHRGDDRIHAEEKAEIGVRLIVELRRALEPDIRRADAW